MRVLTLIIMVILTGCSSLQKNDYKKSENKLILNQADLTKFVKVPDMAAGPISELESISNIMIDKFVNLANDEKSEPHKEIQSFFNDYKINHENVEHNIYPEIIEKEHLTIHYLEYFSNHGFVGQSDEKIFNAKSLTLLITIPAIDNFRKGQGISTLTFKMLLEINTESNLKTNKEINREEKIEIKKS